MAFANMYMEVKVEDTAQDVIVTALVLGLLLVVITFAKGNIDIIQKTALATQKTDKVAAEVLLPLNKGEVTGADVVSVIRYYYTDSSVAVVVKRSGFEPKSYHLQNYNRKAFEIPLEARFTQGLEQSGGKLVKATYTEKAE